MDSGTVSVKNGSTNENLKNITVGKGPVAVDVLSDKVYVAWSIVSEG